MRTFSYLVLVMLSSGAAAALAADNTEQTFNEIFGDRVKQVASTRPTDDDIALAAQMLESAAKLKADEPLRVVLFNNAYDLGRKAPEGYDTAIEAMKLLGEQFPGHAEASRANRVSLINTAYLRARGDERVKYGEQLIELHNEQGQAQRGARDYRAALATYRQALAIARSIRSASADLCSARVEQCMELIGAQRRMELLEKQVNDPPVDPKIIQELLQICVAKFENPASAQDYAPLLDKESKRLIELAIKPSDEVTPADCLALGQWYADFAQPEKGLIKLASLERAEAYLSRYCTSLDKSAPKSVEALKAELALKTVRTEIEKLSELAGAASTAKGRWIDLTNPFIKLLAAKEAETTGNGAASQKDGVFTLEGESARIAAPFDSKNIIFSVEVRKLSGQYITVGGRQIDDAALFVEMAYFDHIYINRWLREGGRTELTDGVFKKAFDGQFHEFQFAILGDTLIAFLDGKEILRVKEDKVTAAGKAGIGVRNARAEFRKPRVLIPSAKQIEAIIAKTATP
ncbi:MAG: hypothetical protein WD768_10185 [Phycisphaeraceae bacterium]